MPKRRSEMPKLVDDWKRRHMEVSEEKKEKEREGLGEGSSHDAEMSDPNSERSQMSFNFFKSIFPDVDEDFLQKRLNTSFAEDGDMEILISEFCEGNYRKKKVMIPVEMSPKNVNELLAALRVHFVWIRRDEIRRILRFFNFNYTKTRDHLQRFLDEASERGEVVSRPATDRYELANTNTKISHVLLLKHQANTYASQNMRFSAELQREIDEYEKNKKMDEEKADRFPKLVKEDEENGFVIECAVCFDAKAHVSMVQCEDGHFVCRFCLQQRVVQATRGELNLQITCMLADCRARYLRSVLAEVVPRKLLDTLDARIVDTDLARALVDGLHRCPRCQYAAVVADDCKVFDCPQCGEKSCKFCRLDWHTHFGKPCEEVMASKKDEIRKKYEEKLTEVKLRICGGCNASIERNGGCDHMTCTCGFRMCYRCRKPVNSHKERQAHQWRYRECAAIGEGEEYEDLRMKDLRSEASEKLKLHGFTETVTIGLETSHSAIEDTS